MKIARLYYYTIALSALFAGGCIVVLFVLIPFWFSLPPENLMQWFTGFGATVGITMLPSEIISFILCIIAYFKAKKLDPENKRNWMLVNISNILMLISLFVYFLPVDFLFVKHSLALDKVNPELKRWEIIHIARTLLSLLSAFLVVVITIRYSRKKFA